MLKEKRIGKKERFGTKACVALIVLTFIVGSFSPVLGSQLTSVSKNVDNDVIGNDQIIKESLIEQTLLDLGDRGPEDLWWNTDWSFRKIITINHTKVEDDLTNFPVLIQLESDSNLSAHAQSDGEDIVYDRSGIQR